MDEAKPHAFRRPWTSGLPRRKSGLKVRGLWLSNVTESSLRKENYESCSVQQKSSRTLPTADILTNEKLRTSERIADHTLHRIDFGSRRPV
ncbi:hypothetical protein TNCV_1529351 [Trichonephila clavipes]|uniref:Uncharacterized protein n=1 Tax=Trichonephila clavipes TaxID=2585209 RepID=A0A8X6SHW4_TRICX|nr:hypothetical protein TNCV_1529351 [Trichonephila clavipes]